MIEAAASDHEVALVFGGSRGIGAAAAARLAREGFRVALTYVSSPGKAGKVVAAIVRPRVARLSPSGRTARMPVRSGVLCAKR